MLIQCPFCRARAKLADSKSGSKVRCSSCERVFVAREAGVKRTDPTPWLLGGGGALAVAAVLVFTMRSNDEPLAAAPPPERAAESPPEPPRAAQRATGWEDELVQQAAELHELAYQRDEGRLTGLIDGRSAYELAPEPLELAPETPEAPEASEAPEAPEGEEPDAAREAHGEGSWYTLARAEQADFLRLLVSDLSSGAGHDLAGAWKPYDGERVLTEDDRAVVRLRCTNRHDPTLADRIVEWGLVRDGSRWKAWYWRRVWTAEELEAARRAARPKRRGDLRTLSDGSVVLEGAVRPIPWMTETPEELREQLRARIEELVDIDALPPVRTRAHEALVEVGKPSIPGLLTWIAEHPLDSHEQAMRLQRVHMVLEEITGHTTSFTPRPDRSTSEERQDSGLRQWFGWYDSYFQRFEPEPGTDPAEADSAGGR